METPAQGTAHVWMARAQLAAAQTEVLPFQPAARAPVAPLLLTQRLAVRLVYVQRCV